MKTWCTSYRCSSHWSFTVLQKIGTEISMPQICFLKLQTPLVIFTRTSSGTYHESCTQNAFASQDGLRSPNLTCLHSNLSRSKFGLGSRMTKICPIQYIDQNACKYKSAWDIFKNNNNNKFEKPIIMVAMVTTTHYMVYYKTVCFNQFHS